MRAKPFLACAAACGLALAGNADAATIAQLQKDIESQAKVTIVDVRSTDHFAQGHIPGAINIPAKLAVAKKLPPVGKVVVYDDGLGDNLTAAAVTALNAKPGISAEALEGGFAAWRAAKGVTTHAAGVEEHSTQMITYDQLKTNQMDDIVIVDLRAPQSGTAAKSGKSAPGVDLQSEFPNARVTRSPFAANTRAKSTAGAPPLLVLVDKGDGAAQQMAKTLKANGVTRFVILAGGEEIITRQGQPGLKRDGSRILTPPITSSSN